jgi:hypothetical protein
MRESISGHIINLLQPPNSILDIIQAKGVSLAQTTAVLIYALNYSVQLIIVDVDRSNLKPICYKEPYTTNSQGLRIVSKKILLETPTVAQANSNRLWNSSEDSLILDEPLFTPFPYAT